jgi:arginine decarboxylase
MTGAIIPITSGVGRGRTKLAAFDAALFDAVIANYNLLHLISIIPDGFTPVVRKLDQNAVEYGFRLYVVLATATAMEGWGKRPGRTSGGC